jgi:cytidine deaminase
MVLSSPILQELIAAARRASACSYAPYSHLHIGAAVLTEHGEIFAGCNVENASYSLTICAERNAIFQAVAKGKTHIKAVVIYTPTSKPVAPCGACRQVIYEFGPDADVVSICEGADILHKKLCELLPEVFGSRDLP